MLNLRSFGLESILRPTQLLGWRRQVGLRKESLLSMP